MKLSVIVPAFNEEKTIEELVNRVLKVPTDKEIIIIENGSMDSTKEKLEKIEKENEKTIKVIYKDKNVGKSGAVKEGFKHVTGDYVIIQDADLEYEPSEYLLLINALKEGRGDVIFGSRFKGRVEKIMKSHYFGNRFLTLFHNFLYGTKLTDMETCYKLFPASFAKEVSIKSTGFGFEAEITSKLLKKGYKIYEVPITYRGRTFEEGKKISWKHGIKNVWEILKFRFFS